MPIRIELLDPKRHDRAAFGCGVPSLDSYLKTRASQDANRNISTTFCLVDEDSPKEILGYYTLAPGGLDLTDVPEALQKQLPAYPQVPVFRLGRLAVRTDRQDAGLGTQLLVSALRMCLTNPLNAWAVVVDALPSARDFYLWFGFEPFFDNGEHLFMTMADIRKTLS